jgi:hypothetical protein
MLYRPNFCCNCGEKIERADWTILSSRKFCDLCQTEHGAKDRAMRLISVLGIVCLMAVVSSFFRPYSPAVKSIPTEPSASLTTLKRASEANLNTTTNQSIQSQNGTNLTGPTVSLATATATKSVGAAKESDIVYYCGAATKKGTPCSRRVKHAGERCWQHQGMRSILDENGSVRKK